MRRVLIVVLFWQIQVAAFAQIAANAQFPPQDSTLMKAIDDTNRKIDRAVVSKDLKFLAQHYGDDFVFTHATGLIDSKKSWMEAVQKNKGYGAREHDSTVVELHKDVATISGKLTVTRLAPAKDGTMKYSLWYVRVFRLRNKNWEMISHRSTSEWHHD